MALKHGKYLRINNKRPRPMAQDDYSGFMCMHSDLVRQMEYSGRGLIWTGYYVNKRYADVPNPQNLSPILRPDPVPVLNPRPCPQYTQTS
jgi:hypothetical protein